MANRRVKIAAVFLGVASVLAGSIGLFFWIGLIAIESADKVAAQRLVIQHLEKVFSTLKDMETGQRGFLLTGEERYLQPFHEAATSFNSELETLRRLAQTGDLPAASVDVVSGLATERRHELEQAIQIRREQGLEASLALVRSGRGKVFMDQIRKQAVEMAAVEQGELDDATRRADRANVARAVVFIVVGLLNLAFLAWTYRLVRREIAHREQVTEEIQQQRELLATTLASIGDGVIITDPQGQVRFLNPEAERLTEWTTAEAKGQALTQVFRIVHESTKQPVENPVEKVLRLGRVVGLANHTVLIGKSGRETPIDDSAAPICEKGGQWSGVVLVFRDFTEHKQRTCFTEALNVINQQLHSSLRFERVMEQTIAAAAEALGCETAAVSLRCHDHWEVSYVHGFPSKVIGTRMGNDEERHALLAIETKQPVAIDDAFNDARVNREHMKKWKICSVLAVPLLSRGEAVGVMFFNYMKAPVTFRQAHIDFVHKLGASVSLALDNCRLVSELQAQVMERTRAEAAVRQQEQWLRALMETVPAAVWIGEDPEAQKITGNATSYELLRLTGGVNASKTGMDFGTQTYEFYRDGQLLREELPMQMAARTGRAILGEELEVRFADGSSKWIFGNAVPLRDAEGRTRGSVGAFIDITARKRAEEALRESQVRLAETLASISDGFIALDREWRFTYVNDQAEHIFGKNREEMLGQIWTNIFPELAGSPFAKQFYRAAAEHLVGRFEARLAPLHIWYECNCYPSRSGLSIYYKDISDRKRAEAEAQAAREELARINARLEATVEKRTAKLRETVSDLEQFSYSLAHDLRAPLRSMCSFSSFLLEDYSAKLDEVGSDYLRRVASAAKRMDELIRDVLTYSQVVRTQTPLKEVDLDRLVREIVDQYPHLRPDQATVEVASPVHAVIGTVALVTQCVSNLLGNAVKFVEPGIKPHVRVWTHVDNGRVRVCVRDNGTGIDPNQAERIWRIFERAHDQEQYPGTGIGLSIVKRAAEKMGGTVGVESELGKGSTFWFELAKA